MSYLKIMQEKVVISLRHILDCDVQNPFNKMEPLPTSVLNCLFTYLVKEMGRQGLSERIRYPLVIQHSYGKSPFLLGKSTVNGPFSIVM